MLRNIQGPNIINHINVDNISLYISTFTLNLLPHSSLIFRHFHEKFTREFRTQAVYNNHNDAWLLIWRGFTVQVDFLFRNFYFLSSFFSKMLLYLCSLLYFFGYTHTRIVKVKYSSVIKLQGNYQIKSIKSLRG